MKTIFRFLSLGLLALALGGFSASAQQPAATPDPRCADVDGQTALYTTFTEGYAKKTSAELKPVLAAGKEFLEKYGACGDALKDQIAFVQPQVQRIEKLLPDLDKAEKLKPLFARYDAAITSDNADEVYAAGKEILSIQPDNLNIMVPMGVVGLYKSYNKDNKYADDSIRYAKSALDALKSGKSCNKKNKAGEEVCGVLKYEFMKQNAIDELSYAVAYLTYYAKADKKGALPLYYELSQSPGKYKTEPRVYATIGGYFGSEIPRLTGEVAKLIARQKGLPTDEEKIKMEPEIKAAIALLNGYAERAMDGFIRAYSNAKTGTPAEKTYKDGIYKDLTVLYQGRFDKKDGLDSYIASVTAKPMPNPTLEVTPIADPEPATTTTTTTTTPVKPATTGAPAKTAPAAVVTKPVSDASPKASADVTGPTKTPSASTVAVKGKPAAKKPVARKKGKG